MKGPKPTYITLTCQHCQSEFIRPLSTARDKRLGGWQRYCSAVCSQRGRDPNTRRGGRVQHTCAQCGASFERAARYAAKAGALPVVRYCSEACRTARVARTCEQCGESFYAKPSQGARFCSQRCMGLGRFRQTPRICRWCGRQFTYYPSSLHPYCNTICRLAHIRADPTQHPNFRGGRYPYYGPNWPEQRRLARERDQHTCQQCGLQQTRPKLHVHHIRPRRHFNGDFLAANDLGNLVTLCRPCHKYAEHHGLSIPTRV